jgi:hypothetical protein
MNVVTNPIAISMLVNCFIGSDSSPNIEKIILHVRRAMCTEKSDCSTTAKCFGTSPYLGTGVHNDEQSTAGSDLTPGYVFRFAFLPCFYNLGRHSLGQQG